MSALAPPISLDNPHPHAGGEDWDDDELDHDDAEGADGDGALSAPVAHPRYMKDPVFDYITIDDDVVKAVLDSPQFQRMRYLKQLGTSYFVWPGASHNRFEHCVGVCHLAGQLVERLQSSQPELQIDARDVRCVKLAGLCHDLGHGPFSHMWDGLFMPLATGKPWAHEKGSEMMLDYLFEDMQIDIKQKDVEFVKGLIAGEPKRCPDEKPFLFQIVANKINGIDVDKFDYIKRDSRCLGVSCPLDVQRLIGNCRVIGNEICYASKEVYSVYELFLSRYSLHKRIYNHKAATAIQYMLVDALLAAKDVLQLVEKTQDPRQFLYLTDSIIEEIERSTDAALAPSRALIRRVRLRHLYKVVDYQLLTTHKYHVWFGSDLLTSKTIAEHGKAGGLREEDVIVDWTIIHFGMREKNPIESVRFYSGQRPNRAIRADKKWFSFVLAERFQEVLLRCYTRDPSKFGLAQQAFRAALEHMPKVDDDVGGGGGDGDGDGGGETDLPTPQSSSPNPSQERRQQDPPIPATAAAATPALSRKRKRAPTTPGDGAGRRAAAAGGGGTDANPFTTVACEYRVASPMESPVRKKTPREGEGEGEEGGGGGGGGKKRRVGRG